MIELLSVVRARARSPYKDASSSVNVFVCACVCTNSSFFFSCQILSRKRDNHPEVIIYMSFGQKYGTDKAQIAY